MNQDKNLHPKSRIRSFGYAINGLRSLVGQEPNAKIHLAATVTVIALGFALKVGKYDWMALLLAIALVWIAEALNTCIEMLCNLWCDGQHHPKIKIIKDIAAGAVLVASIVSVTIAALVLLHA